MFAIYRRTFQDNWARVAADLSENAALAFDYSTVAQAGENEFMVLEHFTTGDLTFTGKSTFFKHPAE